MTTLIEDLKAVLDGLAPAGGVHYAVNESQPAVQPFIVFQRVVSTSNNSLQGPSALQNTRVQIDIVAASIAAAVTLQQQLQAAMQASALVNVPISSQDLFDFDSRLYRISSDWSIWSTN